MLAISYAPWFSWSENALSDLGVGGTNAVLFNAGLIGGGILYLPFAWSIMRFFRNRTLGKIGGYLLALAAVFLVGIGVFPENTGYRIHLYVSVGFFASLGLSLLFQSATMIQTSAERNLGAVMIFLVVIGVTFWILHPWKGVAIPELISGLIAAIWSFVMSVKLLRGAPRAS
jgi:hypothetical membrane protein